MTTPLPGRIVWYDLITTDPERAKAFYTELLGWTTRTMSMGPEAEYTMFANSGKDFGGIEAAKAPDVPSHWIHYTTVEDVDAAAAAAKSLGGAVHVPPTDIPTVGRFAIIADPTGGFIAPFRGLQQMPEDESPTPVGAFVWPELSSSDRAAAAAFLCGIFGWTERAMDVDMMPYTVLCRGDKDVAGIGNATEGGPTFWLSYVKVADVDAVAQRAVALGGSLMLEPMDIPGIGRIAIAQDPTGAPFGLHKAG